MQIPRAQSSDIQGRHADANAVEAFAGERHFLIGVGIGKIVSAGTDVGLSRTAQRCLTELYARSRSQTSLLPSLDLVRVQREEAADDYVRYAMLMADDGDILFFLVDDAEGCEAVMDAVHAHSMAVWPCPRPSTP